MAKNEKFYKIKKKFPGAGEMFQQLQAHFTLAEDPRSSPRTNACDSSSREHRALF